MLSYHERSTLIYIRTYSIALVANIVFLKFCLSALLTHLSRNYYTNFYTQYCAQKKALQLVLRIILGIPLIGVSRLIWLKIYLKRELLSTYFDY